MRGTVTAGGAGASGSMGVVSHRPAATVGVIPSTAPRAPTKKGGFPLPTKQKKPPVKRTKTVAKRAVRDTALDVPAIVDARAAILATAAVHAPGAADTSTVVVPMRALLFAGRITAAPVPPTKDKAGWSESRRRYVLNYLAKLQTLMRLSDWEITVSFDTVADDDCYAEIKPAKDQRRAELVFGKQFFFCTSADQRQTLVHELLHLHVVNAEEMATGAVASAVDDAAMRAFDGAFSCEVERTVDVLADVIAPLLDRFEMPSR
jgi:hypothetical protein